MKIVIITFIIMTILNYLNYSRIIIFSDFSKNVRNLKRNGDIYKGIVLEVIGNSIKYKFIDAKGTDHYGISTLIGKYKDIKEVNVYCEKDKYTNNCSEYTIKEVEGQIGMINCMFGLCVALESLLLYMVW